MKLPNFTILENDKLYSNTELMSVTNSKYNQIFYFLKYAPITPKIEKRTKFYLGKDLKNFYNLLIKTKKLAI